MRKEFLTIADVAKEFDVSERTVSEWCKNGFPHTKLSARIIRFKRSRIDDYMIQNEVKPEEAKQMRDKSGLPIKTKADRIAASILNK